MRQKIYVSVLLISMSVAVPAHAINVIPSGECVGVKLYTDGLVVVDTTPIMDIDGKSRNPAEVFGIKKGDILKAADGIPLESNEMLAEKVTDCDSKLTLTICRDNNNFDVAVTPVETSDGKKLGLWLRDSTAGLGTITCYYGNNFAALGHGICDIDTGKIMPVNRGVIQKCKVISVNTGSPGALTGEITGKELGIITQNTEYGLFGKLENTPVGDTVEVASKSEVKCKEAYILADIDGSGAKKYTINIKRVSPPLFGTKDMVISITDPELIEKTGGIVQGMSGAPIIQNNKLVGAVTHVFVNDSLSGYAILAEHMIK